MTQRTQSAARRRERTPSAAPTGTARPDPLLFHLGYLIHDVSRMRRQLFDQEAKSLGITRSQWWVLGNLSRRGNDGIMQTDLARKLDVGKVTIGGIVDRLEVTGYVERRPDAADRRAKRIYITRAGHAVLARLTELGNRFNDRVCAGITDADMLASERALAQMKNNLKALLGPDVAGEADD